VDLFAEIADERRTSADLLSGLTEDQLATPSLCGEWSVREVFGHLVMPLTVTTPRFLLAMLACRGSFDRANTRVAREQARRPIGELVELLRERAGARFTPPGSGPEAPLTDLLVHGSDIRWPLGLTRVIPEVRASTSLTFLTATPARGFVRKGTCDGLRFEATDIDWAHGSGPVVRGDAEALLLGITGRATALARLEGGGAPTLRERWS
jgi:uncharacterized protein (TIGR03083 family)